MGNKVLKPQSVAYNQPQIIQKISKQKHITKIIFYNMLWCKYCNACGVILCNSIITLLILLGSITIMSILKEDFCCKTHYIFSTVRKILNPQYMLRQQWVSQVAFCCPITLTFLATHIPSLSCFACTQTHTCSEHWAVSCMSIKYVPLAWVPQGLSPHPGLPLQLNIHYLLFLLLSFVLLEYETSVQSAMM